jgi:fermentation-respiration switch protein FrsA (DUF1100 family)
LARIVVLLGLGIGGVVMIFEEKFIYFPGKHPDGMWEVQEIAAEKGHVVPKVEDCRFITQDGVKLHGWYCTPSREPGGSATAQQPPMVFLFFHGNAGNITYRYDIIRRFMSLPVHVLIIDYRGYGKSQGRPSEKGLYLDAKSAWDYLSAERGIPSERVILFGKSLGGAVAVDLATHVKPAGLIVQSSFTSIPDMAHTIFPFLPRFLVRTKMDSIRKIREIDCPKLFVHSPEDELVPYRLGLRLFEEAREPKTFYTVQGASHNDTYLVGGERYLDALQQFIASCAPGSVRPSHQAGPDGGPCAGYTHSGK